MLPPPFLETLSLSCPDWPWTCYYSALVATLRWQACTSVLFFLWGVVLKLNLVPHTSTLMTENFSHCGPGNSSFAKVHNHQDLRMTFKTHLKRPSTIVCTCIPNFEEVSTSRRTSGLCLASSLKDSVSKTCNWHLRNTTHACVPAQMCTYDMYTWKIRLVKQPGRLLSLKCK